MPNQRQQSIGVVAFTDDPPLFSVQIFFPGGLSYSESTNEIWHTFEGWPFLPSMKSQQFHILPIVTVAIAKQNDGFYASASLCDGFYSVRDGFTIASVSTIIATDEPEMNTQGNNDVMTMRL